jgi:hypothetical protein
LGAQPNGRQEVPLNDNEYNSSDTSVEDSKIQFQNNLRKFKAKCDNELEKLLEKCESRRKTNDRKYFGSSGADLGTSSSARLLMGGDVSARSLRRYDSANNNNSSCNNVSSNLATTTVTTAKDDDENVSGGGGGT